MKAGTTSLYRDLLDGGGVYFAPDKETDRLASDEVLSGEGIRDYAALYRAAKRTDICGDASTTYAKLPRIRSVPERALSILGPDVKILYMVRHPVDRIESHHHFLRIRKVDLDDINVSVRSNPDYLDFSRYWMQISPWLSTFGDDHVMAVQMERYSRERGDVVSEVRRFLGLNLAPAERVSETVFNRTHGQPIVSGNWRRLSENALYRRYLRPLLSVEQRRQLQLYLLPKAYSEPNALHDDTLAYLREVLADDILQFQAKFRIGQDWDGFDGGGRWRRGQS